MKVPGILCEVGLCLSLCAGAASAQSPAPSSSSPTAGWQVELVPYLWGSGVDGTVGIGNRTADVDASFRNVLDHLHFAAMGMVDAHHDRFTLITDVFYTDLRGQAATPGPLFSSVNPQQKLFIMTPLAGYRVIDNNDSWVDVVGGMRLWQTKSELQFRAGVLPSLDVETSRGWGDAIVGLRARTVIPFASKWWVNTYGDLGGGGSDFTWQVVGTAGLDFQEHYALVLGYRYLSVDFNRNNYLLDTALKGPIVGFTFKF